MDRSGLAWRPSVWSICISSRDVRLPEDVLLLDVTRNGPSLVPNGYTRLQQGDEVTLLGQPESLEAVTIRLGY